MSITVEQAKSLAVCYNAFMAADMTEQPRETAIWGSMLLDSQKETGVEILENWWLERVINKARAELDALAA